MTHLLRPCSLLSLAVALSLPGTVPAQEAAPHPMVRNLGDMTLGGVPGLPTCARAAVQSGDPTQGPSIILARLEGGCAIPWHWHTPNERLMMVEGEAEVEPRDGTAWTLRPGGFALMPTRQVHRFRCLVACILFVNSDAAFDIRYVDRAGVEISPEAAHAAIGQTVFRPPAP